MNQISLMDYDEALERFDPVIGLEVHVELNTASKMFCACATTFGAQANTQTCPVCLGLPGSLPVVNGQAIEAAIRIGLSLNCQIASRCCFARKNYFYPDMTKNFQTSQHDQPICFDGSVEVEVDGQVFTVPIERAHMEEDAGKSLHIGGTTGRIQGADYSLEDYNRAGVPLIEIVTRPVMGTGAAAPAVARAYVTYIRDVVRALGVSDVRMEQGSLRCDANVSLSPKGSTVLGTRTETKNVNSLRSIERALRFEICRQAAILDGGGRIKQETRHWHEEGEYTSPGRSKEQAEDYRYFPEPDLVTVAPSPTWVEQLRVSVPPSPTARRRTLRQAWGLSEAAMNDLIALDAVELVAATVEAGADPAAARKWWTGELARLANLAGLPLDHLAITADQVAQVQALIDQGQLSDKLARAVIGAVVAGEGEPEEVVAAHGWALVSDQGALQQAVDQVIAADPDTAEAIRAGRTQAIGALIGAVMRLTKGQADAATVRQLLIERLA
ncbi:MAG: Asp-tRNA(Asn)/Glu-tRNA(Gln) amidotransferase subunit GatB [Propionibacteriaceae bacterium]|jgi:aspartyl-tRNA(Asn)/glutamyl-tRNA(Gln) amidotransferase subunit B|nr:Asp-tRNA(Asn)/Glu-tRNA(Gln) amidotransferase subunit GatB [Propionibacteriaceae bacterium]